MPRSVPIRLAPEWDPAFTRAIVVSLGAHLLVLVLLVSLGQLVQPRALPLTAYTVELTDGRTVGGRLPPGPLDKPLGGLERRGTPKPAPPAGAQPLAGPPGGKPEEPAAKPPQPAPPPPEPAAKAPEPAPQANPVEPPEPAKPVEPVPPPEPAQPQAKVEPPKPEAVKPEPPKPEAPKPEAKKPEPPKPDAKKPEAPKAPEAAKPQPAKPPATPQPASKPADQKPDVAARAQPAKPPDAAAKPATPPGGSAAAGKPAGAPGGGGTAQTPAADAPTSDAYAAAMDRFRTRGGGGGLAGPQSGTGPIGTGGDGEGGGQPVGLEFLRYLRTVEETVRANWNNPLNRPGLVAIVKFTIHEDGTVSDAALVKGSGDAAYDLSTLRAVQRTTSLPEPPERYRKEFREIQMKFHSEQQGGLG